MFFSTFKLLHIKFISQKEKNNTPNTRFLKQLEQNINYNLQKDKMSIILFFYKLTKRKFIHRLFYINNNETLLNFTKGTFHRCIVNFHNPLFSFFKQNLNERGKK